MKDEPSKTQDIALLWTGGWDSTFQLLQLLNVHNSRVVPFYLIDATRPSTGMELLTIKRIKDYLLKEYPHARELLQPTRYFAVADIASDPEIEEAFHSLLAKRYIGKQYDWISRFCKQSGIEDIQLSIHRDDKAHLAIQQFISKSTNSLQTDFRIDPSSKGTNEYLLFKYFSFPIFELSKLEMSTIANKHGWEHVMNMTWFCHQPRHNKTPCGACNPCKYTIQEGLGWRVPLKNRLIAFSNKTVIQPTRTSVKLILSKLGLLKYIRKHI